MLPIHLSARACEMSAILLEHLHFSFSSDKDKTLAIISMTDLPNHGPSLTIADWSVFGSKIIIAHARVHFCICRDTDTRSSATMTPHRKVSAVDSAYLRTA